MKKYVALKADRLDAVITPLGWCYHTEALSLDQAITHILARPGFVTPLDQEFFVFVAEDTPANKRPDGTPQSCQGYKIVRTPPAPPTENGGKP